MSLVFRMRLGVSLNGVAEARMLFEPDRDALDALDWGGPTTADCAREDGADRTRVGTGAEAFPRALDGGRDVAGAEAALVGSGAVTASAPFALVVAGAALGLRGGALLGGMASSASSILIKAWG